MLPRTLPPHRHQLPAVLPRTSARLPRSLTCSSSSLTLFVCHTHRHAFSSLPRTTARLRCASNCSSSSITPSMAMLPTPRRPAPHTQQHPSPLPHLQQLLYHVLDGDDAHGLRLLPAALLRQRRVAVGPRPPQGGQAAVGGGAGVGGPRGANCGAGARGQVAGEQKGQRLGGRGGGWWAMRPRLRMKRTGQERSRRRGMRSPASPRLGR